MRRAAALDERGIHYVDVGTSGGVWGLEVGYCMMVGGHEESVERLAPILDVLAPPDGWRHFGDAGAGHFVKMVHNGVEYGIMQAYAEGFELMHKSKFPIDLKEVAGLWNRGSVVRSWLCELAERAFEQEGNDLEGLKGHVSDSGEGRWTIIDAIDHDVPTPVITASLYARFYSRGEGDYTHRVLAALRNQFGGHAVERAVEELSRWPSTARARRTRSSRGSSGSRSRRRRWSSSARPATSRTASCCPRSTTSRTRARCPSAST